MKYIDMNISSSALPVNVYLHWVTNGCGNASSSIPRVTRPLSVFATSLCCILRAIF